jgi:hypothetical protein
MSIVIPTPVVVLSATDRVWNRNATGTHAGSEPERIGF